MNQLVKQGEKENYILMTNVNNCISITGVAVATAEKQKIKKFYITYNMHNKPERSEINEQTYDFVQSLFDLIISDKTNAPIEFDE